MFCSNRPLYSLLPSPTASRTLAPPQRRKLSGWLEISHKKSNDLTHVSTWLIKQLTLKTFLKPLVHLINLSFQSGMFSSFLTTAKVTPIFKKGDSFATENYICSILTLDPRLDYYSSIDVSDNEYKTTRKCYFSLTVF